MTNRPKYIVSLSDIDIEYALEIYDRLTKRVNKNEAKLILSQSIFFKRLNEDGEYVNSQDPEYWVDILLKEREKEEE